MTENTTGAPKRAAHKDTSLTRRRALAVTGGTVVAGGLAVAGYQAAFAGPATGTEATGRRPDPGPAGLRHVQAGARTVLDAGGTATPA
ncbi:hypothetical protein SUDANB105_03803 [Streptomyces sp. enrichment culture]|uniref:hypothetical protein n=1 Tax=Streptomyces sp. enrichment culture TaxID=1795815 RepID=UPI003F56E403